MLSRDQPVFAISESAIFVLFRVCCLLCVPSKCAFSTLQALAQSPSIPDLRRKNKAEFAASQLSSTESLFQFFSGCCFALPASRDSDLVQPMQSRTSSTKKGRSISSKSAAAASSPSSRRPVVPSSCRPFVPFCRRTSSPKMENGTPNTRNARPPGVLPNARRKTPVLAGFRGVAGRFGRAFAGRFAWRLAFGGPWPWPVARQLLIDD